jgi:hypothetical protein
MSSIATSLPTAPNFKNLRLGKKTIEALEIMAWQGGPPPKKPLNWWKCAGITSNGRLAFQRSVSDGTKSPSIYARTKDRLP